MKIGPGRYLILVLVLVLGGGTLAGCGYHRLGTEPRHLENRRTLAVPLFVNRSTEIGLESIFANALIANISRSQIARVTNVTSEADVVLEGKIFAVEYSAVAMLSITKSLVRRISIRVELILRQKPGGKVLWKENNLIQEDYVIANNNYQQGEAEKGLSLRRAADEMARRTVDKLALLL